MPAGEPRETSYYEVSLTNRQVMVAFAFLLVGLVVSFLSGVWVGKTSSPAVAEEPPALRVVEEEPAAAPPAAEPAPAASPVDGGNDGVPRLDYFQEGAAEGEIASEAPAAGEPEAPPEATSAPAVPPERVAAAAAPSPPPTRAPPSGAAPAPAGPAEKPKWRQRAELANEAARLETEFAREESELEAAEPSGARPAPAAPLPPASVLPPRTAAAQLMVQVFSSKDAVKAREILTSLQDAGYPASLTRSELPAGVTYRVRIGPYRDRPAAQKVADDVSRKMKLDTWITTE